MNCHNGEAFLKKSINSVINQSYKKWEIIFWDNKSTDNSKKIVKKFKDKRIKYYYSKKFNTLYTSRNLAIKKAKGKYICFLDADDTWLKNKLKRQVFEISKDNTYKLIYTNFFVNIFDQKKAIKKFSKILNSGYITQKLLDSYDIGILTVLIDRKVLKKYKFNCRYNIIGDFDLFINLSLKYKIKALQQPLAKYRIHNNNYSSEKMDIHIKELSRWLKIKKKDKNFKTFSFKSIYFLLLKLRIKFFIKNLLI